MEGSRCKFSCGSNGALYFDRIYYRVQYVQIHTSCGVKGIVLEIPLQLCSSLIATELHWYLQYKVIYTVIRLLGDTDV
jgi:hypothetical protein